VPSDPRALSARVALRTLVQDEALPVAAHVCGPGECGYWAQLAETFTLAGRSLPPILPRVRGTVLKPKLAEQWAEFGVALARLTAFPPEEPPDDTPPPLPSTDAVSGALRNWTDAATQAMPDRAAPFDKAAADAAKLLERAASAAVDQHTRTRRQRWARLRDFTFPRGAHQEKHLALISVLAMTGVAGLEAWLARWSLASHAQRQWMELG
jgi:uncharacterized protein YllA (UPF0747 family)